MPWRVVERKIGRAGGLQQRNARQREWDRRYGEGNWEVGYVLDGEYVTQTEAQIRQADAALAQAEARLKDTEIRAPLSGVVSLRVSRS